MGIQGPVEFFGRDVEIDTALFYRPRVVNENVEPARTFHRVRDRRRQKLSACTRQPDRA
ncbi:MAG TPA: hypothetical protein VN153_08430 [Tahibacter sp.]|nr:hypothetical protein [Tahibacter sp.]